MVTAHALRWCCQAAQLPALQRLLLLQLTHCTQLTRLLQLQLPLLLLSLLTAGEHLIRAPQLMRHLLL